MPLFVMWIRYIPGLQYKVADRMTKLEKDYGINCLFALEVEEDDMIQAFLAFLICDEDSCIEDEVNVLQVNYVETVELFQSDVPAPKVWTPEQMFAEVLGG